MMETHGSTVIVVTYRVIYINKGITKVISYAFGKYNEDITKNFRIANNLYYENL